ncbi:HEAT repeat domain-containing protein [candidate division KSB1 bacterium]|nr:HEAT repeat domain-containing protein [candidate division KSB1 bacterium]
MSFSNLIIFFSLHLSLCIIVAFWLNSQFLADRRQAQVWSSFGFLLCFFLPIFGVLGVIIVFLLLKYSSRYKTTKKPSEFDEHLRFDRLTAARDATINEINWVDELELQPLVDALKDADVNMRKGAIEALAKRQDRESIRALSDALENTMLTVRYFAVEALGKISKEFGNRILEVQKKLEKSPDSFNIILELANCYYEFATSEVEDVSLSRYYLTQAANQYSRALEIKSNDLQVKLRLGNIFARLGEMEKALSLLTAITDKDAQNIDAQLGLAEVYLKQGKIREVRNISKLLSRHPERLTDEARAAIQFWIQ